MDHGCAAQARFTAGFVLAGAAALIAGAAAAQPARPLPAAPLPAARSLSIEAGSGRVITLAAPASNVFVADP